MIGNLAPYCDQHHGPMRPSRILPGTFRGCKKDKLCERRYDTSIGYYADSPAHTRQPYCLMHYSPLFVCVYDSHNHSRRYACPVQGCEYVTEWLRVDNF